MEQIRGDEGKCILTIHVVRGRQILLESTVEHGMQDGLKGRKKVCGDFYFPPLGLVPPIHAYVLTCSLQSFADRVDLMAACLTAKGLCK